MEVCGSSVGMLQFEREATNYRGVSGTTTTTWLKGTRSKGLRIVEYIDANTREMRLVEGDGRDGSLVVIADYRPVSDEDALNIFRALINTCRRGGLL